MWAFTKAAQHRITASGAVFQHPVKAWFGGPEERRYWQATNA